MAGRSLLALGALSLVLVAGCSGAGERANTAVGVAEPAAGGSAQQGFSGGPGDAKAPMEKGAAVEKGASAPEPAALEARQLIRTARIELSVAKVEEAVRKAQEEAKALGGFASEENAREQRATLTVRVPADKLDEALNRLDDLGKVIVREQRSQDVTDALVDTKSRLESQRASVNRVRALLERANTVSEIVQVEGELTKRQAELESLQRRLESMSKQVAMATVSVSLVREDQAAAPSGDGFLDALAAGWRAFLGTVNGLLIALGASLPFLVVLGIAGALVIVLLRRRRNAAAPAEPVATGNPVG
ncbi:MULTISPECIES: DUF4349 domain-containing protein [unclassified Crossiella]|uniref:DUF4349 domain-containing protein n=1 Tax=unclassified Crossiella TaxID=2620835 RepID=UPI001FFF9384|nr:MULTISPECIES: DUF4349 domain-containing protein [unclassified Crossiella]MCK2236691.1 DUF4349 domain-containing protein [Crossiella sp. S99.2]MCK2250359.1 DUF4349 domain-containing protein [Crossiella sp. S99.1]